MTRRRGGYRPTNNLIKPKFPFIEDQINKENVIEILENAVGLPDYYSWRSRSGCSFYFFQRRIEWVGLLENHPEKFAYAKSLEKLAKDNKSPFTWIKDLPLEDLEKPESIKKIKEHHQKKLERLKTKKSKDIENNPFLKGEDVRVEENVSMDDVSSSCLICHK